MDVEERIILPTYEDSVARMQAEVLARRMGQTEEFSAPTVPKTKLERREHKYANLVNEYGEKCQQCGNKFHFSAMTFYSPSATLPYTIEQGLARGYSLAKLRFIANKCKLLCWNCAKVYAFNYKHN